MIQFKNLTKSFGSTKVLRDISLEVEKGELVVFIGESGCGKTTLLKTINRLIRPTKGKILINGDDIEKEDVISLRRNIGYVIQQTGLFPHMTVRDNIEIILKVEKNPKEEIEKKSKELMEMVGLDPDEYLDRYPSELSGGQQQRIGVARAFANDPDIILMDEPFSALDPITRESLQDELVDLQAKMKKTIVFVTHDMDEAIKIADRICILQDGKVLQYDTSENILKNPIDEFVSEFVGKQRIWATPELIKAEDIMIYNPVTCTVDTSLEGAMKKMRRSKVDSLIVKEEGTNKFLGIIRPKYIRRESDHSQKVSSIMIKDAYTVNPEDSIIDILGVIEEKSVSNVPVVDENKKVLGLITKSSLVTTLSHQYIESEEGVI